MYHVLCKLYMATHERTMGRSKYGSACKQIFMRCAYAELKYDQSTK